MKAGKWFAAMVAATASGAAFAGGGDFDIVIYGSTPAAISAAVQAKRMGASAVVISPETRIGGMTTGGLGQTDVGNKSAFGGIALEFYRDVAKWYADDAHWTRQTRESYFPDGQCEIAKSDDTAAQWTFEPSAALAILEGWEKRDGLDIRRGEYLDRERGVAKKDGAISEIRTLSGNAYRGKVFIDATYEGDLMAAAGVSYRVGREANSEYGETISGVQRKRALGHQLWPGVDPYVVKGDPKSGLLPLVVPKDEDAKDGEADKCVQAYCFRMCLTDDPANRIPFAKPEGYDPLTYEILLRNLEKPPAEHFAKNENKPWIFMPWINSPMPNRKTDTNNRTGFSTDFIGRSHEWPEASYAERAKILKEHLDYQRGLMWTLANDLRVPEPIRTRVARWGTCKDEFLDGPGDGWQSQLYVREARRMVGETVMTERHCRGKEKVARPVALGTYGMDSHNVRRYVGADGFVHNEGDVQDYNAYTPEESAKLPKGENWKRFPPFGIDYGAIVPKRAECKNILVPVCLSATHMAFGAIRMEPVFFTLGQVAGTAAALAVSTGADAVQDLPYPALRERLTGIPLN